MTQNDAVQYMVRDPQGNIFGPADEAMLRRWVMEGRIIGGMSIAVRGSEQWVEASVHPALADLLAARTGGAAASDLSAGVHAESMANAAGAAGPELGYGPPAKLNMPALFSLITGVLGILSASSSACCCVMILAAPMSVAFDLAAVILGIIGLWQISARPDQYFGKAMAIVGTILGALALLALLGLAVFAFIFGAMHR